MEEKLKIFFCEDDENLGMLLREYLQAKGYVTDLFSDGEAGYKGFTKGKYDLCVLDVMMPKKDGFTLAQEIRALNPDIPVIFLTAKTMKEDILEGFKIGADDYLTKPFDKRELVARIQAIVRRSQGHSQSLIQTGKIKVNLDTRTVEADGKPLHLTGKEYGILELLSLRKGTTLTKEMFLNHLYGGMDEPEVKIIDVFICKLRKKLAEATDGSNYIETVWGRGYVLRDPEAEKDKKAANA